jgi:hypothetical protein
MLLFLTYNQSKIRILLFKSKQLPIKLILFFNFSNNLTKKIRYKNEKKMVIPVAAREFMYRGFTVKIYIQDVNVNFIVIVLSVFKYVKP